MIVTEETQQFWGGPHALFDFEDLDQQLGEDEVDAGVRTGGPPSVRSDHATPHAPSCSPNSMETASESSDRIYGSVPDGMRSNIPEPPAAGPPWGMGEPTPGPLPGATTDFLREARTLDGDDDWGVPVRVPDGNAQEGDGGVPNFEEDETEWAVHGAYTHQEEYGDSTSTTPSF